jgi:hypothetical protein
MPATTDRARLRLPPRNPKYGMMLGTVVRGERKMNIWGTGNRKIGEMFKQNPTPHAL